MPLPKAHQPLRLAVATLLRGSEHHRGKLYNADDVAAQLNIAADVDGNENVKIKIDTTLLAKAFSYDKQDEYTLAYGDCFGFDGDKSVLYFYKEREMLTVGGGSWSYFFGRFDSIDNAREAKVAARWNVLPEDTANILVRYLEKESKPKESKKGKRGKKNKRQSPPEELPQADGAKSNDTAGEDTTTSKKRRTQPPGDEVEKQPALESGEGEKQPAVVPGEELDTEFEGPVDVCFNMGGRVGKMTIVPGESYSYDDFVAKLLDLPYEDSAAARRKRQAKVLYVDEYGAVQYWLPAGIFGFAKNHLAELRKRAEWGKKFEKLLSGKKCTFSYDFQRTLAQFGLHNMRGSDEGMELLIAGVIKGIAEEIGIPLSNKQLAKIVPSRRTIARAEKRLGAEGLLHAVRRIMKDKAKWLALMVDHGKRSGIEHFVKLLIWAGLDESGNRVIKYFCLDIDKSGHGGNDCASAIKKSIQKLEKAGLDTSGIEFIAITGDAGGGGAVQNIFPKLTGNGVLAAEAKMMNCQYHALNKCFEIACSGTFGTQGIHKNNIFQGGFIYIHLLKALRELGGHELIDTIHSIVVEKLVSCKTWQGEAVKTNKLAADVFFGKTIHNMDTSDEVLDAMTAFMTMHVRNVKSPNMSRWFTVLPALKVFLENWTIVYFICVAITQCSKVSAESSLGQYAGSLLGVMNTASGPAGTKNDNEEHCPPIYAQGLFVVAFGEAFFERHFDWLLRHDPHFGKDSWGQTIRLWPERVYMMHRDLEELMDDENGWKKHPAFEAYVEAVEHIPDLGNKSHGDKSYFLDAPGCFMKLFGEMFVKHVSTIARSNEILAYLAGSGSPILRDMFFKWLRAAKEDEGREEHAISNYVFEKQIIRLEHHGASDDETTKIDTQKCLGWLTEEAEPLKILEDPLISECEELWWKVASAEQKVDLFDEDTWNGEDYAPLVDHIHGKVAIHAVHQQRVENLVQLCSLVSSTNVEEARRSWRAMALSAYMRPFNQEAKEAVEKQRKEEADPKKKAEIKRVEGSDRVRMFGDFCDRLNAEGDAAIADLGEDEFKALVQYISGDTNKQSRDDLEETKKKFAAGAKKKRKVTKQQENPNGIDLTADMDGAIKMVKLTLKYDNEMKLEVEARQIVLAKEWKEMDLKEKRDALRLDEMKHLMAAGKCRDGMQVKDVKQIVPVSDALIALKAILNNPE